jgi:hypothetical protein
VKRTLIEHETEKKALIEEHETEVSIEHESGAGSAFTPTCC